MTYWERDWTNGIETTLRAPVGDLIFRRDTKGRLLGIRYGGHVYLSQQGGWSVWDGGFVRWREERTEDSVLRHVEAGQETWTERFGWDATDRLVHVDGVDIRRDDEGRVVACFAAGADPAPEDHRWFYHYQKDGLAAVDSPAGSRIIAIGPDGRPTAWSGVDRGHCRYDAQGQRTIPSSTPRLMRDAGGRVWAEMDPDGAIRRTYLWDGHRCLARIDGPLGGPLAAVFSLDPSGTPVRASYRDRTERFPRDAYGEGLVGHRGVPGLFGGFQAKGFVYLPWRILDPRLGSFTGPDPFDGSEDDPRRGDGAAFAGNLTVEAGSPSPYAVARHDPVGRTDPTGAISGLMLLSDFTWSWQNNLLTFFGIDWWFNLVFSLFTGFQLGNFASSEVLTASDRIGAGAIRRDGFLTWISDDRGGTPAFATQHLIWAHAARFDDTERAMVLDPREEFRPTLYGTLLRAAPDGETAFLLRGMRNPGAGLAASQDWTRQGGTAAFAAPNLPLPIFPSGGFHLANGQLAFSGNRDCPLTELDASGNIAVGTFDQRAVIRLLTLTAPASVPAVGDLALLGDADGDLLLTPVVSVTQNGGWRTIRLEDDAPAIGPAGVSLELINPAPTSSEARAAAGGGAPANSLTAIGATANYTAADLLRLTASTGEVTAARVNRLEARLPLNAALPATMTAPIQLTLMRAAANGPNGVMVDGTTVDFTGATAPSAGTLGIVVTRAGGNPVPVRIANADNAAAVTLDTDVGGTHAAAAEVQFRPVSVQSELGQRTDAVEAAAQVTYTPRGSGTAPDGSAGLVLVRASDAAGSVLRQVNAAPVYDAVVMDRAFAGTGPWTADRMVRKAGTTVQAGLQIDRALAFTSPNADRLSGDVALRLIRATAAGALPAALGGAAQITGLTMTAAAAGGVQAFGRGSFAPGTLNVEPRPGQPVLLRQGGTDTVAVVSRLRQTITIDRAIAGLGASNLECVSLVAGGPTYTAERLGANQIAVNPEVQPAGGGPVQPADFPRFRMGEIVEVTRAGAAQIYSIDAVSGGRLDLDQNDTIPGAAGDALRVRRVLPSDPANGHWLAGRNGRSRPGNLLEFDVTSANVFGTGTRIGVIDGNRTWPAIVDAAAQDLQVFFAGDPGLATGTVVNLHGINVVASEDAASFTREDQTLLMTVAMGASAAGEVAIAQGFAASDRVASRARLSPGTLLVPNDEGHEVDRRQSFIDHELTHTIQYTQWGPLWFCYFPLLLLELPVELTTDLQLPDYGPFVTGTVQAHLGQWHLIIPDRVPLNLAEGTKLQIVQGTRTRRVEVVSIDAEKVVARIEDSGAVAPPTGNVHIRRIQDEKGWEITHSLLQMFTHGGLLNLFTGSTWGGLIFGISKLVYGAVTAIKGTGDLYPAEIENNGQQLRMSNAAGREAINSPGRITIKQGSNVIIRDAVLNGEGLLGVTPRVTLVGGVRVGRYDTQNPDSAFDWLNYYAGTLPDLANPFAVTVPGEGNRFHAQDRVEVKYQAHSFRTSLTAANGDALQLQDPVPLRGTENSLRIARVDTTSGTEATGAWDSAAMTEMGMGWMKWLFDPWGQFDADVDFGNGVANGFKRAGRFLLGSQNFSLLPFLGYVFYGRFFRAEHLAKIEQLASGESGELYTPLSRITGQIQSTDDYASYRMLVGDIARFRFWTNNPNNSLIDRAHQMEPGVFPEDADLRTVVFRAETAAAGEPNGTVESGPGPNNTPARAAADLFALKPAGDPSQLDGGLAAPSGLDYTMLAQVPERPNTMRHRSVYIAFTEPGQHRLTTANDIDSNDESREAREVQEIERQTIFFNVEALDVAVTLGGTVVNDGDIVDLLAMQRAAVTVAPAPGAPSGGRRWRLTVQRPDRGDELRRPGDLELQARASIGAIAPVELSRYYAWNQADNSYSDGGLQAFGLHLGGDVDIAVRRFRVRVVDTLPLRAAADASAAAAASLAQGADGFLLIPSPVAFPPRVATFDGRNHAPGPAGDPAFTVENVTPMPAAAQSLVGSEGRLYRISFAAAPVLAAAVPVEINVTVGDGGAGGTQAILRCTFNLTP